MVFEDVLDSRGCTVGQSGFTLLGPGFIVGPFEQSWIPPFAKVIESMLSIQEVSAWAYFRNHRKCQGLFTKFNLAAQCLHPADHLLTNDQLCKREGKSRFQVANIVDYVSTRHGLRH